MQDTNPKVLQSCRALELQCDASGGSLGTELMENQQSIAFSGRALMDTERKYVHIKKACFLEWNDLDSSSLSIRWMHNLITSHWEASGCSQVHPTDNGVLLKLQHDNVKIYQWQDTLSREYLTNRISLLFYQHVTIF